MRDGTFARLATNCWLGVHGVHFLPVFDGVVLDDMFGFHYWATKVLSVSDSSSSMSSSMC